MIAKRVFYAYLLVVFINATVDLGHKITLQNALLKVYLEPDLTVYITLLNALILLPFILLFTQAGWLCDRFSKVRILRVGAALAFFLSVLILIFYYLGWFFQAYIMTFIFGIQSAIYAPAKFGYLRESFRDAQLSDANGKAQAAVMLGVLTGMIAFSFGFQWLVSRSVLSGAMPGAHQAPLSEILQTIAPLGWFLLGLAALEWLLTFCLPHSPVAASTLPWPKFRNFLSHSVGELKRIKKMPNIWPLITAWAAFWSICQVILIAFPIHAATALQTTNPLFVQAALGAASIGIVAGALLAGRLGRRGSQLATVTWAYGLLFIAQCALWAAPTLPWAAAACALIGAFGGWLSVVLNVAIQKKLPTQEAGRILAAAQYQRNFLVVLALCVTFVLGQLHVSGSHILFGAALLSLAAAGFARRLRLI